MKSYPSTNWYLSSLAAQPLGLTHEELVIANGASELISAISDRFVSRLAVAVPTFDEFVNRAATQGKTVSAYQLSGDFHLDVDDFARHVLESGANAALLINPNNPTGLSTSKADVLRFLDALRNLDLVIVDESFIDFVDADPHPSIMSHLADYPNAIVLKSLSKAYGIPGLRLGYAASVNQSRIAELRSHLPIWGINSLAQFYLETIGEFRQEFIESCAEGETGNTPPTRRPGGRAVPHALSHSRQLRVQPRGRRLNVHRADYAPVRAEPDPDQRLRPQARPGRQIRQDGVPHRGGERAARGGPHGSCTAGSR